jgi:Xaa-Pro aminopeptidase
VFSWRRHGLTWLTGYWPGFATNYAGLWIPSEGTPILAVRFDFERERAIAATGLEVLGGVDPQALVTPGTRRLGLVAGDFAIDERPRWLDAELTRRDIEVVDLNGVLDRWRAVKSPDEVQSLIHAARLATDAVEAAGNEPHVGESDFAIAARVEATARAGGATRAFCATGIGAGAFVTEPSGAVVQAGDPVMLELTVYTDDGCSQVNLTILPRDAQRYLLEAVDSCRDVRRVTLEKLQPGQPVDEAVRAGERALEELGLLSAFVYDLGHGVGLETPEQPRLVRGTTWDVEVGMVLAVHVAVRTTGGETAFVGGPVAIESDGAHEMVEDAQWSSW